MGRKSKRMALYEAIRQGQAKIAQGLENGQMRSDGMSQQHAQQVKNSRQKLVAQSALFESPEVVTVTKKEGITITPAMMKIGLASGGILVLLLILWLGSLIFSGSEKTEQPAGDRQIAQGSREISLEPEGRVSEPVQPAAQKEPEPEKKTSLFSFGRKDDEEKNEETKEPEKPAEPVFESSIGKNVIVIQSIAESRKEILDSLKDYFDGKGIPTEIIFDDGNALLVTRQGFDSNPANYGTEGYQVLQKIKQLGLVYPQETGDTKWGVRPFQAAWGLKRKK